MKGGSKEYWFVLTAESLSWYKDEEVRGISASQAEIWLATIRWHVTTRMYEDDNAEFHTGGMSYPKWRFGVWRCVRPSPA